MRMLLSVCMLRCLTCACCTVLQTSPFFGALYLLAVHAIFTVSGVRVSSPDSGPVCTYVGPWPSFWARVWGLVCELFLKLFGGFAMWVSAWNGFVGAVARCLLQVVGVLGVPVQVWEGI